MPRNKFRIKNLELRIKRILYPILYTLYPKKGFTLIELMVAIMIIGVVSAIGLTAYSKAQVVARDGRRKQDLRSIQTALELFYQTNKHYPCINAGWTVGGQANFIKDECPGGTNQSLATTYINTMPKDPSNKIDPNPWADKNYNYGYYSQPSAWGTCPQGQYYFLVTQLENSSDKDTFAHKQYGGCGQQPFNWMGANTFAIVGGS